MSIFKKTFKPHIVRQLLTRQALMSQGDGGGTRTENVQKYTTAKRAWSRMASFVNYEDPSRGYSGDKLARKYVLQGGTLVQDPNDDKSFGLRFGVGKANGAYGSNLGDRQLGLRPMPGIESITIQNKSAYGSLRQATIKYKAWDKAQLEDLEILYMRMKYPVLLEWGWSMYMNTYKEGSTYTDVSDKGSLIVSDTELNRLANSPIKSFIEPTIDPFDENQTQYDIYEKIKVLQHRFSGNYDGMLGFVENFTWELAPDGGFICTTILISMGDVLASLKMNRPTPIRTEANANTGYKTHFTQLLEDFTNGSIVLQNTIADPGIDTSVNKLDDAYVPADKKGVDVKDSLYYIQLAYLIAIINDKSNFYDLKGEKFVDIEIPTNNPSNRGNGLCLASEDSVSVDPSVCLIKNKKATFATGLVEGYDIGHELGNPNLISKDFLVEGEKPGRNFGVIGNIYVSVKCVRSLFEEINSKGDVLFYDFIKELLKKVSIALGDINDFDLFVYNNKAVIIDKNYTEISSEAKSENKFRLNIFGNHTVVRNYKVMSKIFQSQAAQVAIAASNRENLGGYNTSTQVALNKGLSNRIVKSLSMPGDDAPRFNDATEVYKEREDLARSLLDLQSYLKKFLTGKTFPTEAVPAASTILKNLILGVNSDTNYRAIIPVSLEVTMDGIGGVDIAEIFTAQQGVLPREYEAKHVGFIVVKEAHTITSDWTTTLEGKVVLLDQEGSELIYPKVKELKANLSLIGGELKVKEFRGAQDEVLYYRQILALIKAFYEDYLDLLTEVKYTSVATASSNFYNKTIETKYAAITTLRKGNDTLLKYSVGNSTLDIKPSDLIGSLVDNSDTAESIKKYSSYAKLETNVTTYGEFINNKLQTGYREVSTTIKTENQPVVRTQITGLPSVGGNVLTYNLSQGYTRLLTPFEANKAKNEVKEFLKELLVNTTHYKTLKYSKLKKDVDDKLNLINKSLVDDGLGIISIIPLKADQDKDGVISFTTDPESNFTILNLVEGFVKNTNQTSLGK